MILWAVLTVMTAIVAVSVTVPLVRRHNAPRGVATNVTILRQQLADLDQDEASGAIAKEQAERTRLEINRRILAEGRVGDPKSRPLDPAMMPWLAIALAGVIAIAATGLYALVGRPDLAHSQASVTSAAGSANGEHPIADVGTMIGQLKAKVAQSPNDPEGWRMLGWSYLSVGRAADSAKAYARAVALDPNNAGYRSAEGDALVQSANGQVTPQALDAFHAAIKLDATDPRARYYLALYEDQQGQHDKAMADWIALLKSAPPGAPWVIQVGEFVRRLARDRHIDVSKDLAGIGAVPEQPPGPTQDQMQQAQQMSPAQREATVRGMVERLAADLKANPRNEGGWIELMRAHMVLGEADKAAFAYRDAQHAFANTPGALVDLRMQAKSLGVPGA